MKSRFVRYALSAAFIFSAGLLFVSCDKNDNVDNNNNSVAGLMAFNLTPDKAVSITLSGNPITNSPLSFTSYTGSYLSIYSGNRLVQTYDYSSNTPIDSSTYNFEPQEYYSLFVIGNNGAYKNLIVNDNFDSLNNSSQAYIRYVNAIADSSSPTVSVIANNDEVVNNNAPYSSVSDFTAVTPGDVTIQVNNGGTINTSRTITLEQQKAYTVLLAGVPGSTGNDSLQIRYIENGTLQQSAHKVPAPAGSSNTN
jgi:hypothetical protein